MRYWGMNAHRPPLPDLRAKAELAFDGPIPPHVLDTPLARQLAEQARVWQQAGVDAVNLHRRQWTPDRVARDD